MKGTLNRTKLNLTFQPFGLQFENPSAKRVCGFVIKWFYLVGSVIQEPSNLVIHCARRQTYGPSGYNDYDPAFDVNADAKTLGALKYPKLQMERVELSFDDIDSAKVADKAIKKKLALLGQGTFLNDLLFRFCDLTQYLKTFSLLQTLTISVSRSQTRILRLMVFIKICPSTRSHSQNNPLYQLNELFWIYFWPI